MKPSEYKKLEDNKPFKRHYMNKTLWWKNFLIIAPACLIFIGLAGIMHMSYNDRLWTLISIPYIVVFALGTIWLKAIKKYIQDRILSKTDSYLACAAKNLGNYKGRYYFVFSKDSKRHNEPLINQLGQELSIDSFSEEQLNSAKKASIEIETSEKETQMYLRGLTVGYVTKANKQSVSEGITPLLFVSLKDVFVIREKDLR